MCAGRDTVATVWLALALWLFMCLGETRLLSQARMAMVAWAAIFSLPPAYSQSRRALHSLTDEMLAFAAAVLAGGAPQPHSPPNAALNPLWSSKGSRIA